MSATLLYNFSGFGQTVRQRREALIQERKQRKRETKKGSGVQGTAEKEVITSRPHPTLTHMHAQPVPLTQTQTHTHLLIPEGSKHTQGGRTQQKGLTKCNHHYDCITKLVHLSCMLGLDYLNDKGRITSKQAHYNLDLSS